MKKIITVFLGVLFVSVLLETNAALASALELRIQNDFAEKLYTAVVYYDDGAGAWTTKGWYIADAKAAKTIRFSTSKQDIFIYSELAGSKTTWGKGDVTRVVIAEKFEYRDSGECPAGTKRRSVKFTKYTAKNGALNYRPKKTSAPLPNAGGPAAPAPNAGDKKERRGALETKAANIVNLINTDRENAGLPHLSTGEKLNEAARIRARELSQKNSIDTRPDGRSFDTALTDSGVAYSGAWSTGSVFRTDNTLEIYQKFYGDAGYRGNVLSKEYSAIGVGIFERGGDYFCVQILCAEGAKTEKSLSESWKELEQSLKDLGDLFD